MLEALLNFLKTYALTLSYIAIISLISIIITAKDKIRAIKGGRRTPEKELLTLSALGGSLAMLLTMLIIRHKTKHKKFMIGIPLIMILQAIALFYLYKWEILI